MRNLLVFHRIHILATVYLIIEREINMGITQNDLKRIKDTVVPIAQKFGVEKVTLFGSMARGDNDENSDYDFLIKKGEIRGLFQLAGFIIELEEAFKTHVDVVSEQSPDEYIVNEAKKDGVLIYERQQ